MLASPPPRPSCAPRLQTQALAARGQSLEQRRTPLGGGGHHGVRIVLTANRYGMLAGTVAQIVGDSRELWYLGRVGGAKRTVNKLDEDIYWRRLADDELLDEPDACGDAHVRQRSLDACRDACLMPDELDACHDENLGEPVASGHYDDEPPPAKRLRQSGAYVAEEAQEGGYPTGSEEFTSGACVVEEAQYASPPDGEESKGEGPAEIQVATAWRPRSLQASPAIRPNAGARYSGKIKAFKGTYGFIVCDVFDCDIFVHKKKSMRFGEQIRLAVGDSVTFLVEVEDGGQNAGQLQAREIELVTRGSETELVTRIGSQFLQRLAS